MPEWVIKYWVEWLFGIITSLLLLGYRTMAKRIKADHDRQTAIEEGMQAMLRTSIIDQHNKWKDKGYYPIYARENMDYLSKAYFKLNGNGVVPDLLKQLSPLPTEPPRKDEENEEHRLERRSGSLHENFYRDGGGLSPDVLYRDQPV